MSDFKRVPIFQNPLSAASNLTPENRYWAKFSQKHVERFSGRVNQISFSEKDPQSLLVCAATRVHIYDVATMTTKKTVTRFGTPVNCADMRDDGCALIAGSDEGLVQLFDLGSRAILRSYSHQSSVRVCKFIADGTRVFSGGDDKVLKQYDLPSETEILSWSGHTDHIRTAIQSKISPDVIITGSYDHTVKMLDIRDPSSHHLSLDHGAPVSSITMINTGLLVTAGENFVKVWDMVSGGKLLSTLSYHQKAITCVDMNAASSRIISSSLDGFVKFYDSTTFELTHSLQCPGPLLTCAIAPDCGTIATGEVSGTLTTRQRPKGDDKNEIIKSTLSRFQRGASNKGNADTDFIVEVERKKHMHQFEYMLKSFQYGPALDAAINTRDPNVVIALLDELQQRSGLKRALQNRTDASLESILKFIVKYIAHPIFNTYLLDLANYILDIYTPVVGQSPLMDQLLFTLNRRIEEELDMHDDYTLLQGEIELLLAAIPPTTNPLMTDEQDGKE